MRYKVVIPTAGTGSRLEYMTQYINKSLITVGNKPALARIIEMFPDNTAFVIPTGYKAELVKEYIKLAYPKREIYFTEVDPYEGDGSGLGLSLLTCEKYLQEPFIFCSCDTLVKEKIPDLNGNWMGYGCRNEVAQYRTLKCDRGQVVDILEKQHGEKEVYPYIGLAGIYDYKIFWEAMHQGKELAIVQGESYGLRALLNNKIMAYQFTWMDTGTPEELESTRNYFMSADSPNILEKADEAIWFTDNLVIKYSNNKKFISDRVERAKLLTGFVPPIQEYTEHMYTYTLQQGEVMSKCVTLPIFKKLLDCSKQFWKPVALEKENAVKFHKDCMDFYKKKTYERVELFYKNFKKADGTEKINDISMPTLREMLDSVNWDWIADGCPGRFHGDYHFENILYNKENDNFIFLDWRQNFGSSIEIGDIYYDLAKLMHGIIVCHELIVKNEYYVEWNEKNIYYDFRRKQILVDCEEYYDKWIEKNKYYKKKVRLMTALIYLNIAALHHYPYGLLLYALGKRLLYQCIYEMDE